MSQKTSVRRCQWESCNRPLVAFDHGEAYPLAGVEVLCLDPLKVRCPHCMGMSEWHREKVRA